MSEEDGYDPELYWNQAPKPTPPVAYGETYAVTPALERAARKLPNTATPYPDAYELLAAALNVEEMTRAVMPYVGKFEKLSVVEQEWRRGIAHNIRAALLGRP